MAQACVLAREAGLQQTFFDGAVSSCLSVSEMDERRKVYQSLYIRDRYSMIASGSLISLEGATAGVTHVSDHPAHWELAKIQDKVHKALSLNGISHSERRNIVRNLQKEVRAWQQKYSVPSSKRPADVCSIVLHLQFVGIRMHLAMASTGSPLGDVLDDARFSCLLLILSCSRYRTEALEIRMQEVLRRMDVTRQTHERFRMSFPSLSSPVPSPTPYLVNGTSETPIPSHRLINNFPITAIFIIARSILDIAGVCGDEQRIPREGPDIEKDVELLHQLLSCFQNTPPLVGHERLPGTYDYKLGRIVEHLIRVIRVMGQHKRLNGLATHHTTGCGTSSCAGRPNSYGAVEVPDVWCPDNSLPPTQTGFHAPTVPPACSREPEMLDFSFSPLAPSLSTSTTDLTPMVPSTPLDIGRLFGSSDWVEADVWAAEDTEQARKRQRVDGEEHISNS